MFNKNLKDRLQKLEDKIESLVYAQKQLEMRTGIWDNLDSTHQYYSIHRNTPSEVCSLSENVKQIKDFLNIDVIKTVEVPSVPKAIKRSK